MAQRAFPNPYADYDKSLAAGYFDSAGRSPQCGSGSLNTDGKFSHPERRDALCFCHCPRLSSEFTHGTLNNKGRKGASAADGSRGPEVHADPGTATSYTRMEPGRPSAADSE
uniref:Uncharacterized protein n=1 Tax=Sphaerodactylus townsendi TaxID=933632 RepID=A0ACB8FZS8_9SAUR